MTTVINLNLLNFFRLKLNSFTVNDTRINAQFPDGGRRHQPEKNNVIDVTAQSRVMEDSIGDNGSDLRLPARRPVQSIAVASPAKVDKTYDRRGKMIQSFMQKGMHVDSYV